MPRHVYEFYGAFGLLVLQGYGLTETTSGIALNNPARPIRPVTVGELFEGIDGKIAEDGEILLRGPAIMEGYFNLPQETAEAIDSEGWFHTGDIGEFDGTYLKITDRKKDLLVLGNGKNVAPQPIENKLRASALIEEAVVLGDGLDSCIALIVPNFSLFRQRLNSEESEDSLAARPEVAEAINAEIKSINKGLAVFERVKRHALIHTRFTIDGGELTPTLKVRRRVVAAKYADVIASLVGPSEE
jgi:long-chain acyl-CoA synthetase